MNKPEALVLAPLPDFLKTPLHQLCACHDHHGAPDRDALVDRVGRHVRAIVMAGGSVAPPTLLHRLPALEIISVFGVGFDGVPVDYCRARGIHVTNTPDVLTDDVADIAVALVLMTSRDLGRAMDFVQSREWENGPFPLARCLRGKVAGIVGLGRIGKAIAQRLSAHGMEIAYHGRARQPVPYDFCETLNHLAERSDFLIVACPGGPGTHHLVNAHVLAALGPQGTLINIARGSVVDEHALTQALQCGGIRAAGLDVFENEPHVPDALRYCANAVLLPHLGSGTWETRQAMADLCVGNLKAHFTGLPLLTPIV